MKYLTKEQIEQINLATLKVLEETGYIIKSRKALDIFKQAGADVDYESELVKIPKEMVLNAIDTAPSKLTLYGRGGSQVKLGEGKKVYYMNGYGSVNYFDWKTQKRRPNTKEDLLNYVRIIDNMDKCSVFFNEVTPQELPTNIMDRCNAQIILEYCEQPAFLENWTIEGVQDILGMLEAVGGPGWVRKPTACLQLCTISPLVIDKSSAERMIEIVRSGIPLVFGSLPQSGGTAPATLAGTLVILNAEALGGLTFSQLINPGSPFIFNNFAAAMDQKYGMFASGGPEMALMQGAGSQLIKHNGMLQIGTSGGTESNTLDVQAGYEKAFTTLYAALSGVELIHGAVSGWVQSLLAHCPAMVVISNEMCGYIDRILNGIEVTEKTLAVDIINEIGPGGNFLMHSHTIENFKPEGWIPDFGKRVNFDTWEARGKKSVIDFAQEEVDRILNEEPVSYISDEAKEKINDIVKKAGEGK